MTAELSNQFSSQRNLGSLEAYDQSPCPDSLTLGPFIQPINFIIIIDQLKKEKKGKILRQEITIGTKLIIYKTDVVKVQCILQRVKPNFIQRNKITLIEHQLLQPE